MRQWLLLRIAALSFYAVAQVWLVQLSSYPLFRHVGSREFHDYHVAWWHSIWGVISCSRRRSCFSLPCSCSGSIPEPYRLVRFGLVSGCSRLS
jgi:hypothetical protein